MPSPTPHTRAADAEPPHERLTDQGYTLLGITALDVREKHVRHFIADAVEHGREVVLVHDSMRRGGEQVGRFSCYSRPVSVQHRPMTPAEREIADTLALQLQREADGQHDAAADDALKNPAAGRKPDGVEVLVPAAASRTPGRGHPLLSAAAVLGLLVLLLGWVSQ